jgi:hypothetical protein
LRAWARLGTRVTSTVTAAVLVSGLIAALTPPAAIPAGASKSAAPQLIDTYGVWTLKRLGYGDRVLTPRPPELDRSRRYRFGRVAYRLPRSARQGPQDWFRLHLRFRIRFTPGSAGLAYVSASTSGRTCAQIKFVVSRERVEWDARGMVDGSTRGATSDRSVGLRFANYLQYAGVRPGENDLVFQLVGFPDPDSLEETQIGVESVRVFADSAIVSTPDGPARLRLRVSLPTRPIALGDTFALPFRLTNVGDLPARRAWASAESTVPTVVESVGENRLARESILRNRSLSGRFLFRALRSGKARLFILGGSTTSNRPGTMVDVECESVCRIRKP